ncbi:hypothetical protein [Alkaliphilus serpentinus]|uniref:TerB family tellurite resistance protein n=1 Tax=Alkaliphilus serpentinus TaxID=1482731 RepID=A0A833HN79_9FIRM|nr:hypothetical protein [Alkaliphilus serpentinus]KAB3529264.1 hypothetical protein F8153_09660 [Alkaliphilus serpentinus]
MGKLTIRPLEKLPSKIKLDYCKLLSLMVIVDGEINQLKMAAFYRLIANIKLPSGKRENLIDFIFSENKENIKLLANSVLTDLSDQERNILRFSLIKDLLIIKEADYVETKEENQLLDEMIILFEITREQLQFIEEELKKDEDFYHEGEGPKRSLVKSTLAKASAIGIPLTALYFSGSFRGLGPLGLITGIMGIGRLKGNKKSYLSGILFTILLGFGSYYGIKWLIHTKDRRELRIISLYKDKMSEIHKKALYYAEVDLQTIIDRIDQQEATDKLITLQEIKEALEKTIGTLRHTKPKAI